MSEERVPLFVRLPRGQAAALDRLVDATGQRKQQLVSEMLGDRLEVGRIDVHESHAAAAEVLTLEEAAALLRVAPESVEALARAADLPGKRVAGEWRFARSAVLDWLSAGGRVANDGEPSDDPRERRER